MLTEPKVSVDENGNPWSDQAISKMCHVSAPFVAKMRSTHQGDLTLNVYSDTPPQRRAYTTKHGKSAVMNTSGIGRKRKHSAGRHDRTVGSEMNPVRQPRPALAQTNLNLPHDPAYGARAIVSAMGADYARQLIDSLTAYLQDQKEGDA